MLYSLVCARYTPIPLAHEQGIHHAYIGTYSQVTNGISLVISTVPRFVAMNHIATVPDNMTVFCSIQYSTIHCTLRVCSPTMGVKTSNGKLNFAEDAILMHTVHENE